MAMPLEAQIVHINNLHSISVRLTSFKDKFCDLQEALTELYSSEYGPLFALSTEENPIVGETYAVRSVAAWYRGVVIKPPEVNEVFEVHLFDVGRIESCGRSCLFKLANRFLRDNAFSFYVHLSQIPEIMANDEDTVSLMKDMLKDQEIVNLIRRAPPLKKNGLWSLPVEISWTESVGNNPFLPDSHRDVYLSQRLVSLQTKLCDFEDYDDQSVEKENLDDVEDFSSINKEEKPYLL